MMMYRPITNKDVTTTTRLWDCRVIPRRSSPNYAMKCVPGLQALKDGLPRNPMVTITGKAGGWIHLTPLDAQPEPQNVASLKAELGQTWPMTSLLDILKETDLRLNFSDALRSVTSYENLERTVLRPRLLLCLHGIGTNAGLQRMNAAQHGATYRDLAYVRRRYIIVKNLRRAIAIVANGTLHARNPAIWGDGTTACALPSSIKLPRRQSETGATTKRVL